MLNQYSSPGINDYRHYDEQSPTGQAPQAAVKREITVRLRALKKSLFISLNKKMNETPNMIAQTREALLQKSKEESTDLYSKILDTCLEGFTASNAPDLLQVIDEQGRRYEF